MCPNILTKVHFIIRVISFSRVNSSLRGARLLTMGGRSVVSVNQRSPNSKSHQVEKIDKREL